jgi:hypothetical protein
MQSQFVARRGSGVSLACFVACRPFFAASLLLAGVSPAFSQCDVSGRWTHTVHQIGTSVWTYTPLGGNSYAVQEEGFGNAQGTAVVNGFAVHVEWVTTDGNNIAGVADWVADGSYCVSGEGHQMILNGGWAGTYVAVWDRSP